MRTQIAVGLGVTAIACGIAGAVLAATDSDPARPLPTATSSDARNEAMSRFSVLGDHDRAAPAEIATGYQRQLTSDQRLDPALTRLAESDAKGRTYVLAGNDFICLARAEATKSGSLNCGDPVTIASGEVLATVVDKTDDGWRVSALVPDGAGNIRLRFAASEPVDMSVGANVASIEAKDPPQSVTWSNADGSTGSQRFRGLTG